MRIFKSILLLTLALFSVNGNSQSESEFKPGGKPVFLVFNNFHSTFDRNNNSSGFEITRFYLGYEYSFSKSLSARATLDIGDPGTGNFQMTAFLKLAYLQYKSGDFTARTGMMATDAFALIDRHWGYRYISKTLQDEYGMNPSADIGAAVEYAPSDLVSIDMSLLNGEGFRKIQSDNTYKYTVGITFRPAEGLMFRGYTDLMNKNSLQNTISLFGGYGRGGFRTGVEYAIQRNNRYVEGNHYSAISAFVSQKIAERFGILARYDNVWSTEVSGTPWNNAKDGQLIMGGIEYAPVQGVRVAPVYRGWVPAGGSSLISTLGLYFEFRM